MNDDLELLEGCLSGMHDTIAAVSPDQRGLPTPCAGWDVTRLVTHVVGQSMRNFVLRTRLEQVDMAAPPDPVDPDHWLTAFDARAEDLRVAWHEADPDATVTTPVAGEVPLRSAINQQLAELLIHRWDLAQATAQAIDLDPAATQAALDWSAGMLKPEARGEGKPFAAVVDVPADASLQDRFVAWFGRDPQWSPETAPKR